MPVLLFPDTAFFLVKAFAPAKNPRTGRINYYETGLKWVKSDLRDPVQREHAHNHYLTLCPWVSRSFLGIFTLSGIVVVLLIDVCG